MLTLLCLCPGRHGRHRGECHHPVPRQQWAGVRHFRPARSALLSDTAHGARRPSRGVVEVARVRRVGPQTGTVDVSARHNT